MPPPLYTPLPLPCSLISAETTNPAESKIRLAAPELVKSFPRGTKKVYQIPITLIQRSPLPSYATSTQPLPPSKTTTKPTSPDPPAYSLIETSIPTTPTTLPLSKITARTITTTLLPLSLGSSPGYLAPLPYKTLLYQIQSQLETHRVIPLTSNLICQCEIHIWTPAPSTLNLRFHPTLNHLYDQPCTRRESPDALQRLVGREVRGVHRLKMQERKMSGMRKPVGTDVAQRVGRREWDFENWGRRMLEGVIREGGVCGFEVYWWVKG